MMLPERVKQKGIITVMCVSEHFSISRYKQFETARYTKHALDGFVCHTEGHACLLRIPKSTDMERSPEGFVA